MVSVGRASVFAGLDKELSVKDNDGRCTKIEDIEDCLKRQTQTRK